MSMHYQEWAPVYRAIRADFGYSIEDDRRARDRLATLLEGTTHGSLPDWTGQPVAVAGAGPSLDRERAIADRAAVVVAASDAAARLESAGVAVDFMVSDLDKVPRTVVQRTHSGRPVAIHAHGDNCDLLERWIPECDPEFVVPTTQAEPTETVANFGGFTDGDRAAFLADHCGASGLLLVGWDFDDPSLTPVKRRKLAWAERLLRLLEIRRGERFSALDGRRSEIDTTALPVDSE